MAEFKERINSPLKMTLIDNRINDRKDCVLGAVQGNLMYGRFMFSVYPKFGLALNSKNLDQVLSFIHKFERSNLMNEGDKIFSITYLVGYALASSHHSIDYKKKKYIKIDDIFSEVGKFQEIPFAEFSPIQDSWSLEISRKPKLSDKTPLKVLGNKLVIGESSSKPLITEDLDIPIQRRSLSLTQEERDNMLVSISQRIDKHS